MYEITELTIEQSHAYEKIRPKLDGKIFHVTPQYNLHGILDEWGIRPNESGDLKGAFGNHRESYARIRGRVSLFDFYNPSKSEIEENIYKCLPTGRASADMPLAFLFISEAFWHKVIPYSKDEFDSNPSQQVVPHVEATYSGTISLDEVDLIIKVSFTENPDSQIHILNGILERGRRNSFKN